MSIIVFGRKLGSTVCVYIPPRNCSTLCFMEVSLINIIIEVDQDKKQYKQTKISKMYDKLPVLSFAVSIKEIKEDWFSLMYCRCFASILALSVFLKNSIKHIKNHYLSDRIYVDCRVQKTGQENEKKKKRKKSFEVLLKMMKN